MAYETSTYTREEAIARSRADLDPTQDEGKDVMNKEAGEKQEPVPIPKSEKKPRTYSESDLMTALKRAHAAKDTRAATAIAKRIKSLRESARPADSGEIAVSTDIAPQNVSKNPYIPANIEAGMWDGITSTFAGSVGTTLETMLPAWATGRLGGENPETGEIEVFQSTPSWLGITDDQWNGMETEERRVAIQKRGKEILDKTYDPDRTSAAYNVAKFTGMLTDPTTVVPLTGSAKAMTLKGAALGSTDAAAYSYAKEGKVDPAMVALGAGLGMLPGGIKGTYQAAKKIPTAVKKLTTPKEQRQAAEKLEGFEKIFQQNRSQMDNHTAAYRKTLQDTGVTEDGLSHWIKQSTGGTKKRQATLIDRVIEPISDRIRKISPTLHKNMVGMERQILETSHNVMAMSDTFLNSVKKLGKADELTHHALKKAMLNGDGAEIERLVKANLGENGMKDYKAYQAAMKDMWDLVSTHREGLIGKEVQHYTHRAVKDFKQIEEFLRKHGSKEEMARIDKLIQKQFKDRTPTTDELNGFYSRYLDGVYDSKKIKVTPGASKGRKLKVVPDELVDAFHHPDLATHTYVRSMTEDAYKKSLFGKEIVGQHGDNLTDSIAAFVNKEHSAGRMSADDIDEIKNLLELRFVDGIRKPKEAIQTFKDMSYAMLLGNPISAATQIGDVFLAAWKVGAGNAMSGVMKAITGRGIKPKDWGLMDSMLEEMVSTGASKKWLRRALSHGNIPGLRLVSFQNVDRIGKATLMNGALRKYQKMAANKPEKLRKLWGEAYGDDFPRLVQELKDSTVKGAKPSSDVKTLVFADLADVQPVTLLEMPEKYLKHPNGRIAYMLRTFQLKYMNLIRKSMARSLQKGDRVGGLASGAALMALFTAGGVTSDMLKHAMLSRDPNLDEIITDNIIANTGIFGSRYDAGKLLGRKPLSDFAGQFIPPVGVFDPFAYAFTQVALGEEVTREDQAKMMGKLPIVGRLIENYGFGGKEKFADKQFKKSMKLDTDTKPYTL